VPEPVIAQMLDIMPQGIPLSLDPPLTLADLVDSRNGQVEAFVYQDGAATSWRRLARKDPLVPGQAYWLAAHAQLLLWFLAVQL